MMDGCQALTLPHTQCYTPAIMKPKIHPISHPAIFIDTSCKAEFFTVSTRPGEDTREVDGVTYQVIPIEISSASHPFYTGKQSLVDTARRVEKFQERAVKQKAAGAARKGKKVKRVAAAKAKAIVEAEAKAEAKAKKKEK